MLFHYVYFKKSRPTVFNKLFQHLDWFQSEGFLPMPLGSTYWLFFLLLRLLLLHTTNFLFLLGTENAVGRGSFAVMRSCLKGCSGSNLFWRSAGYLDHSSLTQLPHDTRDLSNQCQMNKQMNTRAARNHAMMKHLKQIGSILGICLDFVNVVHRLPQL